MKSRALAKCTAGELIEITHIYGCDKFKDLLKQFHIDIHEKIQILETTNKIVFLNSENQQLSLGLSEAYDIFGININEYHQLINQQKRKMLYIVSSMAITLVAISAAYIIYNINMITFSLSVPQITIAYGSSFDPLQYVKTVNNAELILPKLEYEDTGSYPLTYIAKNHFNECAQTLIVNVIDDQPPTIELSAEEVIYDDDLQNCAFYIKAVKDNVDKDLLAKVICSNELHFTDNTAYYDYQVSDSSGNIAKAQLTIIKQAESPLTPSTATLNQYPAYDTDEAKPYISPLPPPSESYVEEIYEEHYHEEITYDEGVLVSYE